MRKSETEKVTIYGKIGNNQSKLSRSKRERKRISQLKGTEIFGEAVSTISAITRRIKTKKFCIFILFFLFKIKLDLTSKLITTSVQQAEREYTKKWAFKAFEI